MNTGIQFMDSESSIELSSGVEVHRKLFYYFDDQQNCFLIYLNKQIYLDGNWIVALTELATKAQILPGTPEVLL